MLAKVRDVLGITKTADAMLTGYHDREDSTSYTIAEMVRYPDGIERLADFLNIDENKAQTIAVRFRATA